MKWLTPSSQDKNAKAKALRTIEDSVDKMEREKIKSEGYEASLDEEEKILESIRDSLKGEFIVLEPSTGLTKSLRQDTNIPRSNRSQAERTAAMDRQDQCEKSGSRYCHQ
jgi:structural maintenance of chromosome 4